MDEGDLSERVRRAQEGDRAALENVVVALSPALYRLALRMLGAPHHAEDATQEVLILVITQLSAFRGDSSVTTWAYRIALRHIVRQRRRAQRWDLESFAEEDLGQAPNDIAPDALAQVEQKLLEEEIFIGCTHVMLQALSLTQRAVYVLGALCELEARDAAYILGTSEVAFRKRLSRARADLDAFVSRHCGVADPRNRCRCAFQVNLNIEREQLDPCSLRFALQTGKTSLQTLQAAAEVHRVRSALELFRAQPELRSPEPFAESVRTLLAQTRFLSATRV